MGYKKFTFQVGFRLTLIFAALLGLAYAVSEQIDLIFILGLVALTIILMVNLMRYVNKSNRDLTNILSGLRFGDYQQTFTMGELGKTFRDLEFVLHLTVEKVKKLRLENEHQALYFQALVEHIPLPLFVLKGNGSIEVLNNATRRTFNVAEITSLTQLEEFGAGFMRDVSQIEPGTTLLTTIQIDRVEQQYILGATQITLAGKILKLISLQNVQSQLDATELATWQNLLRVTSHEILNSLTPVSSLARTAKSLADDFDKSHKLGKAEKAELKDIRDALDTMVKRSEGLTGFVQSYRQLTRMPPPKMQKIKLSDYLSRLESLLKPEWDKKKIKLTLSIEPSSLILVADESMLDQALINLLRNAADALKGVKKAEVKIRTFLDSKQRVAIEIADNGPGIDKDLADKIFVPFFTTKKEGSGVGLTLVRYIVLSHSGAITYRPGETGGSVFRIVF